MKVIDFARELIFNVFFGGVTYIYDIEAFALHKMLQSLSGTDRVNFLKQLQRLNLVQRSPDGRVVALYQAGDSYFKTWEDILVTNREGNLLAYKIEFSGDVCPKKRVVLGVYLHCGRISSIEYEESLEWPRAQEKVRLKNCSWLNYSCKNVDVLSSQLFV